MNRPSASSRPRGRCIPARAQSGAGDAGTRSACSGVRLRRWMFWRFRCARVAPLALAPESPSLRSSNGIRPQTRRPCAQGRPLGLPGCLAAANAESRFARLCCGCISPPSVPGSPGLAACSSPPLCALRAGGSCAAVPLGDAGHVRPSGGRPVGAQRCFNRIRPAPG
jgi:hypothetical protein